MNFEIGNKYNFTTKSTTVLSQYYKNMEVVAIVKFEVAVMFSDVVTIYDNINTELNTTVGDPKTATYVLFKNADGEKIVLSLDWIDLNSIELVEEIKLSLLISNISDTDIPVIKNVLTSMGYKIEESNIVTNTIVNITT